MSAKNDAGRNDSGGTLVEPSGASQEVPVLQMPRFAKPGGCGTEQSAPVTYGNVMAAV